MAEQSSWPLSVYKVGLRQKRSFRLAEFVNHRFQDKLIEPIYCANVPSNGEVLRKLFASHRFGQWFPISLATFVALTLTPLSLRVGISQRFSTFWEGWGFAGSDTTAYLVFEVKNTLAAAARERISGKFGELPCEIYRVRRREDQWYTVQFYTETAWKYCGN